MGATNRVVPGARAVRVCALKSGVDVNEDAEIIIEIRGTFTVSSSTKARECDALASEASVDADKRDSSDGDGRDEETCNHGRGCEGGLMRLGERKLLVPLPAHSVPFILYVWS